MKITMQRFVTSTMRRLSRGCRKSRYLTSLVGSVALLSLSTTTYAVPVGYNDQDLFLADLPAPGDVVDFDSAAAGTTIANGGLFESLSFQYDVLAGFGVDLEIVDDFDTTSPGNALGTNDGGVLQQADDLQVSSDEPINAIGLSLILSDIAFDNEIMLSANGVSVGLDSAIVSTLADGGLVYFLGLIDLEDSFTSFSLTTSHCGLDCGYFLFNIDDITTAQVPEPSTLSLGLLALLLLRGKRWQATRASTTH